MIWVEKTVERECAVPLGTEYATDVLSLTGQGFPVGDTFSTHILSLTGKRERTFFTIISKFFTPHPTGCSPIIQSFRNDDDMLLISHALTLDSHDYPKRRPPFTKTVSR